MITSMIVAVARNGVIGKDNDLVWNLPDDMKYFKETTAGHAVIMGRKNYYSIPEKWRPLPNRTNIVITRNRSLSIENVEVVHDIASGLELAKEAGEHEVFIIGGGQIFEQSLPITDRIYYTDIHASYEGDIYFPALQPDVWQEISRKHHPADDRHEVSFDFVVYERT